MRSLFSTLICFAVCGSALASDDVRSIPLRLDATADSLRLSGRWATDQALDVPLLAKANTAEIVCEKKTMSCIEAVALLLTPVETDTSGELLLSVLSQYTVESWTESEIVARCEKPVADLTLRIDLLGKDASRRYQGTRARGNESADPAFVVDWRLQ